MQKEAKARILINNLLVNSGWRFFDDAEGPANIALEINVKIKTKTIEDLGDDFEKTANGFIDYLLLDSQGFPIAILEAKSERLDPLIGKEQARKYAHSQNSRFVILSNGNLHYFWDLEQGNPVIITDFPTPESLGSFHEFKPNPAGLVTESIESDYVVLTQNPAYRSDPRWHDEASRENFIQDTELKFLRPYQLRALGALQGAVKEQRSRFLFEMATGTGKTLTAAAAIKLFIRTGNTKRVLFLVDRIELETQAWKSFVRYLKNDYRTVIYKENRDDWRKAEIVVSTVQSLSFNNKFRRLFSPTDFDFVISDEAHRSIGGNSRAVFEYFIGYKLGLTATPKDYLKKLDPLKINERDPREWERRQLLDTYKTFGCESGVPTFRYSLIDGVRERYLVNPLVVDARTEITTELLSEEGYSVTLENEDGQPEEQTYFGKDFEKKFFSKETNRIFCETFLKNALSDPLSGEIGKSIVFCVRQDHATRTTQMLNEIADLMFPGKYNSDFAVQVTSLITDAQQMAASFKQPKEAIDDEEESGEEIGATETVADVSSTLEEAEETAWNEIEEYLMAINSYDLQKLVAALLRAMGYHVAWISPPGPDKGIDILAHNDPLGTSAPRIKVQVKRRADKINVDGLRSFMAILGEQDVGIFVSTGGFTSDAEMEARTKETRKLTLIDLEKLVDLWIEHYGKVSESDKRLLPLRPIHYLVPPD